MLLAGMDAIHLLDDPRFSDPELRAENKGPLSDLLQEIFVKRDSEGWLSTFTEMNVPVERIVSIDEAIRNEQMRINNMVVPPADADVGVPLIVNHPVKVSNLEQVGPKRAPDLGQHTEQILDELGYSTGEIQALREKGVI